MYPLDKARTRTSFLALAGSSRIQTKGKKMAYAIARVRKLKSFSEIQNSENHNRRINTEKLTNIRPEDADRNRHQKRGEGQPLVNHIKDVFERNNVKTRKDSVLALEYVFSASNDFFKNDDGTTSEYRAYKMTLEARDYLKEKGLTIVEMDLHMDESNPHVHFIVLPLKRKQKQWKNRHGSGVKEEVSLCSRDWVNNKNSLRELQTEWFQTLKPHAEEFGVNLERGIDAREQEREYIEKASLDVSKALKRAESYQTKIELLEGLKSLEMRKKENQEKTAKAQTKNRKEKWKRPKNRGFGLS